MAKNVSDFVQIESVIRLFSASVGNVFKEYRELLETFLLGLCLTLFWGVYLKLLRAVSGRNNLTNIINCFPKFMLQKPLLFALYFS